MDSGSFTWIIIEKMKEHGYPDYEKNLIEYVEASFAEDPCTPGI
jgi:hypothetical protein